MSKSYLPLFRKYRPQSFKDLVGQENLVKALTNAIELNRIAPAYLFCGPRGTGKTSSARIFAKSLNCINGPTVNPCQECPSCVDITNATGVDVIEIDAATNRGVEGAEDLIAQVHYAPVRGKYKIFIIDEVHMLSATAFNALLKTFEEPPENVIFILATTEPHKVLETIVSRCQRFDFRRITVDDIVKRLREISNIENIKITDDALFAIAKNVSGGLRDSLALLDQVSILGTQEEITKDIIDELLGKVTFDRLTKLLDLVLEGNIEESLKLIDDIYLKGSEPRNLCENFMEFLRNVIIILNSSNPHDIVKFSTLAKEDIDSVLEKKYDKELCAKILDVVIEYYKEVKFATNPYLWVELMIIQASRAKSAPQVIVQQPQVKVQVQKIEQKTQTSAINKPIEPVEQPKETVAQDVSNPVEEITAAPTVQNNNTSYDTDTNNPVEIWSKIVNSIESVPAKFFYSGMAKLIEVQENTIVLGFINQNVITQAKSELKHKALMDGEKRAFGGKYGFEFVQLGGEIKPLEGANIKPVIKQQERPQVKPAEKEISKETNSAEKTETNNNKSKIDTAIYSPKVKEMLEAFGGKIID